MASAAAPKGGKGDVRLHASPSVAMVRINRRCDCDTLRVECALVAFLRPEYMCMGGVRPPVSPDLRIKIGSIPLMNHGIVQLVSVHDDRGNHWQAPVSSDGAPPAIEVGTIVQIQTTITGEGLVGFAVGDDTVAVTEWGDAGTFEFHVLERYAGKTLVLHVAVRRHGAEGATHSDWLGNVDDVWLIHYRVDGSGTIG